MPSTDQGPRAALNALDALPAGADHIQLTGDANGLATILSEANAALETLRRHYVAAGEKIAEVAVNGNGHSRD